MNRFSQSPTFEGLLQLLSAESPMQPERNKPQAGPAPRELPGCIIPLQTQGELPPLFCVHGLGGSAAPFAALAERIRSQRPVYGIQATDRREATSIAMLAASYVEAVRAMQSAGPYHLSGWSLGAIVAHEMARQLEAQGEVVASLILIDAPGGRARSGVQLAAALAFSARGALRAAPLAAGENGRIKLLRKAGYLCEAASMFVESAEYWPMESRRP